MLRRCLRERSLVDLLTAAGRTDRSKFMADVLAPLLAAGLLRMTVPDRPRSRFQRYVTTPAGQQFLKDKGKET